MASRKPLTNEDDEVRELTVVDFKRARPAAEVLPRLIGKEAAAHALRRSASTHRLDADSQRCS